MTFWRVLVCLFLFSGLVTAQTTADPFTYNTLKSGFGIRALSMGSAYTALGEESAGLTFNPAGLGSEGAQLAWESLDANKDNYALSSAQSAYFSPFAISQWKTKTHNGDQLNTSYYGFGRRGKGRVDWGVVYKRVARSGMISEKGESVDLGVILRVSEQFSIGAVGKDLYKKNVSVPANGVLGVAFFSRDRNLILTADCVQDRLDTEHPTVYGRYGAELFVGSGLALRVGAYEKMLTGGAGLIFPAFEIDFGILSDQGSQNTSTQYLFGVKLGKGVLAYEHRRK